MAEIAANGPMTAVVEACPGWTLKDLIVHVGDVHRWARAALIIGVEPNEDALQELLPASSDDLATWVRQGVNELAETLEATDPTSPTWHMFPVDQVAGVWHRRQLHETTVHRWDAEKAAGELTPIKPEIASDGIDEYFEVMLPRRLERDGGTLPDVSLHVHCTDSEGEWFVWNDAGKVGLRREHMKGDGVMRGPAEALLLRLWGRSSPRQDELSIFGEEAVERWLAIDG